MHCAVHAETQLPSYSFALIARVLIMIIDVGIHFWECHQLVCNAQGGGEGGGGGSLSLLVYIIQGKEETYLSAYVRTSETQSQKLFRMLQEFLLLLLFPE